MAGIEDQLQSILKGLPVATVDKIDIKTDVDMDFVPMTKVNMCYICCSVLFNEEGKVLMMQEAKKSCYGTWYLPAGRLERGETLIDGAKREVEEETGLKCELSALLSIEINSHSWMRFTFTGKITGGKLKTTDEKDAESLQAKFFSDQDIQASRGSLRAADILELIKHGRKYWATDQVERGPDILPVISPQHHLILRVVVVDRSATEGAVMSVLAGKRGGLHIPSAVISQKKQASIAVSVYSILKDAFTTNPNTTTIRMCGILGVEHRGTGKEEDGICITALVSFDLQGDIERPKVTSPDYEWCLVQDKDLQKWLSEGTLGKLVPLL